MNPADLTSKITAHITTLAEATDQAAATEAMQAFFTVASKFYNYSDPPEWRSPARQAELEARLRRYAENLGITIQTEEIGHGAQGSSAGGRITLDPTAGTKTLIHELAHELLHQDAATLQLDRQTKEIEAEATAYVVAKHFDIPDLASPNYLALCGANADLILTRINRIHTTASSIINAVEVTGPSEP